MENTNQEVVKLQLKPGNDSLLEVTNNVKEGLYNALENPYYQLYDVSKKGDFLGIDFRTKGCGWSYASDKEKELGLDAKLVWDPSTEFSEKWIETDGKVEKKEVAGNGPTVYGRDFQRLRLSDMEGIIVLSNGKFLMNKYGKYEPNLSFLNNVPEVRFQRVNSKDLNFDKGDFGVIYGEFFISKKGTKCFRILPKEKAKHVLIRDDWGGAFNKYRGRTLPEDGAVYYRRASSNGGGSGYDYGVFEKDFKNTLGEDDI